MGNASSLESCNTVVNISAVALHCCWAKRERGRRAEGERERERGREIPQVLISASLKATVKGRGEKGSGLQPSFPSTQVHATRNFYCSLSSRLCEGVAERGEGVAGLVTQLLLVSV